MPDKLDTRFGTVLAEVRKARGLSQEDLDDVAHRTYISELERGLKSPTLRTIVKLAKRLNISAGYLTARAAGEVTDSLGGGAPLLDALRSALAKLAPDGAAGDALGLLQPGAPVVLLEDELQRHSVDLRQFLAEATLYAFRSEQGEDYRASRRGLTLIAADRRPAASLTYATDDKHKYRLCPERVRAVVELANDTIELISDLAKANGVPIFGLLGIRNLSAFVGEIMAMEIQRSSPGEFLSNPNQDGYPDLLALTPSGKSYVKERERKGEMTAKAFWSPFPHGGIEIKATCGNTPPAQKVPKPLIGEPRIGILRSAEWKAHHRETNNLLGVFWDFVDELPTILAAFYRNDLAEDDWGKIVQPKPGGGRTTSVSIMPQGARGEYRGVRKMGQGWLVMPADQPWQKEIERVFRVTGFAQRNGFAQGTLG